MRIMKQNKNISLSDRELNLLMAALEQSLELQRKAYKAGEYSRLLTKLAVALDPVVDNL